MSKSFLYSSDETDDITSKMNALQTKQQLISIETQLKRVQDSIKQLESMDMKSSLKGFKKK